MANAVLDGTDAVMLSGETSVGAWPVEAVKTLASIIHEMETSSYLKTHMHRCAPVSEKTFSNAIADASAEIAGHLGLAALAVYTESGRSAALMSAHRPEGIIVAFSRNLPVLNRMALYWGVHPMHGEWVKGVNGVVEQAERLMLERGLVKRGDDIAITFGMVIDKEPFQTNIIKLWKVR